MRAQFLDSMDIERERGITIKLQSVTPRLPGPHAQPDRHARPRRLRLRGQPVAGRLRGRDPAGRRRPGHRGPDAGQLLPGPRERPRDRRLPQQDRPARPPTRTCTPPRSRTSSASRPTTSCASAPRPARACPSCSTPSSSGSRRPTGDVDEPLQALIFDSHYDQYRGVVSAVRVMNGTMRTGEKLRFMQAGVSYEADEVGVRNPDAHAGQGARPRRDRLPHRRHQGRGRGPLR